MQRLVDQVAIATGGARGIGGATARRLAAEGARVLVVDVDGDEAGRNVERIRADRSGGPGRYKRAHSPRGVRPAVTLCSQREIHERDPSFISLPRAAAQIEEVMSMTSKEATIILRTDPVAQELLRSTIPARLAYVWRDGTPRVVPMWFHWTGEEFLMGAPPNAPKMKVLADHPSVALTIDGNDWPYPVLTARGTSYVELVDQPVEQTFPEYAAMARRYLGDEGAQEFQTQARQTFARWTRIAIRPEEVRILDFKQRFPSAWSVG